jgi:hypothetical protein
MDNYLKLLAYNNLMEYSEYDMKEYDYLTIDKKVKNILQIPDEIKWENIVTKMPFFNNVPKIRTTLFQDVILFSNKREDKEKIKSDSRYKYFRLFGRSNAGFVDPIKASEEIKYFKYNNKLICVVCSHGFGYEDQEIFTMLGKVYQYNHNNVHHILIKKNDEDRQIYKPIEYSTPFVRKHVNILIIEFNS